MYLLVVLASFLDMAQNIMSTGWAGKGMRRRDRRWVISTFRHKLSSCVPEK